LRFRSNGKLGNIGEIGKIWEYWERIEQELRIKESLGNTGKNLQGALKLISLLFSDQVPLLGIFLVFLAVAGWGSWAGNEGNPSVNQLERTLSNTLSPQKIRIS